MARSSLTPDQLQRIFDEAPSSNVLVSEYIYQWPLTVTLLRASILVFTFDRSDKY